MRRPIHIGLVAQGGKGWMGGALYILNLKKAIEAADPAAQVSIICPHAQASEWRGESSFITVMEPPPKGWRRHFQGRPRTVSETLTRHRVDFVYPITYDNKWTLGLDFPISSHLPDVPWAGWIPDFQHRHLPEFFSPEECLMRDQRISELARDAGRIVLSSCDARADFERFVPEYRGELSVLQFASVGDPTWYAPLKGPLELEVPERFFLVSNQFWAHKNHLLVFEALALLQKRGVRPVVLCTGFLGDYRNNTYAEKIQTMISENGLEGQVKILGLIARRAQVELLRRTIAVIQPSLFEGWSTVVEDTRVLGRPAILSDLAVHKEQDLPGAVYFDRTSAADLADKIAIAWGSLNPGPDFAAEENARILSELALVRFGRRFLEIARGDRELARG